MGGQWLVRIEDIDPPREVPGSSDDILRTLVAYGLEWDGEVLYQSQRLDAYQTKLDSLLANELAYYCQCTRKQIQTMGGTYDGRCGALEMPLASGAIRVRNTIGIDKFQDTLMGDILVDKAFANEDFIIKRRDGFYAYQLAVVMDDAYQQITEVVRGCDLLETSSRQESLFALFGLTPPTWLHLPLVCTNPGMKLSKQNHAPAIDIAKPQTSLNAALQFLGQAQVEPRHQMPQMLEQAVSQFNINLIPKQKEVVLN